MALSRRSRFYLFLLVCVLTLTGTTDAVWGERKSKEGSNSANDNSDSVDGIGGESIGTQGSHTETSGMEIPSDAEVTDTHMQTSGENTEPINDNNVVVSPEGVVSGASETIQQNPGREPRPHFLAAVMMLKNELGVVVRTLDSIREHVDAIVVLDTGSTDGTQDFVRTYAESHGIPLVLEEQEFIDFSTNRNKLLELADNLAEWVIMLDANEELKNGTQLRQHLKNAAAHETCFMVVKQWNTMLFRSQVIVRTGLGWKYTGVVHEHLTHDTLYLNRLFDDVKLFQDRSLETRKSRKRWLRDVDLLHNVCADYPNSRPRDVFYLARTYNALEDWQNGAVWFEKRVNHPKPGFDEEIYFSSYELGLIHTRLAKMNLSSWDIARNWFLRAYEHSQRAEPLVKLAEYYREKQDWQTAFMYGLQAVRVPVPSGALLFMDWSIYSHWRYSLLGIIAYYTKDWDIGRAAILEALKDTKHAAKHDRDNLKLYPESTRDACTCLNTCNPIVYPAFV